MALDPSKPASQTKVNRGTVLLESGSPTSLLCLVHQGEVSAVNPSHNNRILYRMGSNSTPGFSSMVSGEPLSCRYVVSQDAVISSFPVRRDNFSNMILGKLNMGIMAVRSQAQEIIAIYNQLKQYYQFIGLAQKQMDNLALVFNKANPAALKSLQPGTESVDPLLPQIKLTVDEFQNSGGEFPNPISRPWLEEDHSSLLKTDYNQMPDFDLDEFQFLRRMLALPADVQAAVFKADINILHGLSQRLGRLYQSIIVEIIQNQHAMDDALSSLVSGDYSYAEKFFLFIETMAPSSPVSRGEMEDVARFLTASARKLLDAYGKITGVPFEKNTPSLKKLAEMISQKEPVKQTSQESSVTAGVDLAAVKRDLSGSVSKIMSFAGMSSDQIRSVSNDLKSLRKEENPLDSTPELRKLRRQVARVYWETYQKCFHKNREAHGNVPIPVRLMLQFGFFDDEFLDEEHLATLYNLNDNTRAKTEYKILPATDWLHTVASKEEYPSIDEMGLTFFEKLRAEYKDQVWKRESDVPDDIDTYEKRVHYETITFLEPNVRLTSGSPATSFPVLTKYHITIPLHQAHVTYKKMSDVLDRLLSIDYSAFHREMIYNDEKAGILKEFIQQQVIPYFIIVPSIGTKLMMWQDISGRNKASHGRIAVPAFATADLYTLLMDAVGAFRWELTKTIMGPDWNNVSQSSITADYTDYVQFYKKNRDLSPEIKEKLASEFKRFRTDRDRYVNDYINWIKFESQGIMKLNRVARAIFNRHIPFAKPIRDTLANQPAFADLTERLGNIRKKKLRELEVRYRKYGDYGALPEVLRRTIDFYKD